jgi:MFS family permease
MRRIHFHRLHQHSLPEEAWDRLRRHPDAQGLLLRSILIVSGVILIGVFLDGTSYSFSVFFKFLENDLGLSRSAVSSIFSVNVAISGVSGFLAGWLLDKWGPRRILFAMGLFTSIGLILSGFVDTAWQMFFTYGLLLGMGAGPAYTVTNSIVMRTIRKKQGLVVGMVNAGEGMGIIIMAPIATSLIMAYNWHTAYVTIGIVAFAVIIPVALFVKQTPQERVAQEHDLSVESEEPRSNSLATLPLGNIVRMTDFWLFAVIGLVMGSTVALLFTHVVPHATDVGLSSQQAAVILSLLGITSIFGAIVSGIVSDRLGEKLTTGICSFLLIGSITLLVFSDSMASLYVFGGVAGFAYMGILTPLTALVGKTFGLANVGKVLGALNISFGLAGFLGPLIGGLIYDVRGEYLVAFIASAISVAVATFMMTFLKVKITS